MILFNNSKEYDKYIWNNKGKQIYKFGLLFCVIYSYLVFCLQFTEENARYIYIFLTNWTFTIFIISSTLQLVELLIYPKIFIFKIKKIIFISGLITKPTYVYVCICYSIRLICLFGFDLVLEETIVADNRNWLFYFNDISKHFIFILLLILLFIFQPRNFHKNTYRWWDFVYSVGFILIYLLFASIYYIITDTKVYNLNNIIIVSMIMTMPICIFVIHMGFKIIDVKIKAKLLI